MNPWGYLILDFVGALIFIASILSVKENGNFVVFSIGIFSITIPFGLSAFFMKLLCGGIVNVLINLVFLIGALFCAIIIIDILVSLVKWAFDHLNEWMEHLDKKE